jgi:hypothetical protein
MVKYGTGSLALIGMGGMLALLAWAGTWTQATGSEEAGQQAQGLVEIMPAGPIGAVQGAPLDGNVINVGSPSASPLENGLALQNALNAANPDDVLVLAAGAQFLGPFVLPAVAGASATSPITLQSSALDSLPQAGEQVDPSMAGLMPQLLHPSQAGSNRTAFDNNPYDRCGCINFADGASYWQLIGLEVTTQYNNPWSYFGLVLIGNNEPDAAGGGGPLTARTVGGKGPQIVYTTGQTTLAQCPTNILVDRCYIHGPADLVSGYDEYGNNLSKLKGGIELHADTATIQGCYISGIMGNGFETHGIFCANGPGNYQILNNYIETSCENFFCGGVYPQIGNNDPNFTVQNVTFQYNHLKKLLSWSKWDPTYDGNDWLVKNLFELKAGNNWTIDSNILENCWGGQSDQLGWAFVLTPRGIANYQGLATTPVSNITITNNLVMNCCGFVDMLSSDDAGASGSLSNITIGGNQAVGMLGTTNGGHGTMCYLLCGQASAAGFVDIENNSFTAAPNGSFNQALAFSQQRRIFFPSFTFQNNLCIHGADAQLTVYANGNVAHYGMATAVAAAVIPDSSVTSNTFYKTASTDVDYPLGIISGGVYQSGSDDNADPLWKLPPD